MNNFKTTTTKMAERIEHLRSISDGSDYSITNIPLDDLSFLFLIMWGCYIRDNQPIYLRLKALEMAGVLSNILDGSDDFNSLQNFILREMRKHPVMIMTKPNVTYKSGEKN